MGDHGYTNAGSKQTSDSEQDEDGFRFPELSPFLGRIPTAYQAERIQDEAQKRVCHERLRGVAKQLNELLRAGMAVNPQQIPIARLYPGEFSGKIEDGRIREYCGSPVEAFMRALDKAVAHRGLKVELAVLDGKASKSGAREETKTAWVVLVPAEDDTSESR